MKEFKLEQQLTLAIYHNEAGVGDYSEKIISLQSELLEVRKEKIHDLRMRFNLLAIGMAEVMVYDKGESDNTLKDIYTHCLEELKKMGAEQ